MLMQPTTVPNGYLITTVVQLREFAQRLAIRPDEELASLTWVNAVSLLLDMAREARTLVAKADGAQ